MDIYGVKTGYNEYRQFRFFASTKEIADKIAYLEEYVFGSECVDVEKITLDSYNLEMPKFIYISGFINTNIYWKGVLDKSNPYILIYDKIEKQDSSLEDSDKETIEFGKIRGMIEPSWDKTYDYCKFSACILTIDGENTKDLEKRIEKFILDNYKIHEQNHPKDDWSDNND